MRPVATEGRTFPLKGHSCEEGPLEKDALRGPQALFVPRFIHAHPCQATLWPAVLWALATREVGFGTSLILVTAEDKELTVFAHGWPLAVRDPLLAPRLKLMVSARDGQSCRRQCMKTVSIVGGEPY